MKNLLVVILILISGMAFAQPQLEKPVIIEKKPKLPQNLTIVQPDVVVTHFSMTKAVSNGYFEGFHWYKSTFTAVVRNVGDGDAVNFHIAFFVNDYSHPASGDGWWYNQTQKEEPIGLYDVSATSGVGNTPVSGTNNTLFVTRIPKGQSKTIRGVFYIKKDFVDHYHITIAADANKGATSFRVGDGVLRERSENNNTMKVIPRS